MAVRFTLCLILFLCGFAGTQAVMMRTVPERIKLEWLATQDEAVDVLFLGSSHIYHQFDPIVFDEVRGSGRALNMGESGMGVAEQMYLVERILEIRPPGLKYLVLEGLPWSVGKESANDFGKRNLEWHNTSVTLYMLKAISESDMSSAEKRAEIKLHIEHWWRRSLHLARGVDAVRWLTNKSLQDNVAWGDLGPQGNGYLPLLVDQVGEQGRQNREQFLANPQKLFAARQRLPQAGNGGEALPAQILAVERIQEMAQAQGVDVIWWLHPNLGRTPGWHAMHEQGILSSLIAFDDPIRYPDFYKVKWHFDLFHLTRKGSENLTRAFAERFLEVSAGKPEGKEQG